MSNPSRIVLVSDLHANIRLGMAKVDSGGVSSDRLRDVISVIDQAITHCLENNIPSMAILGDLFDIQRPDGATIVAVCRVLQRAATEGIKTYILPGNHDAVDRDGRLYNLQLYNELDLPNIHVFGHESIELTEGLRLHAVPWLPEARARRRIRKRARGCSATDRDVLFLHQTMLGAVGDAGWVSDGGLDGSALAGFEYAFSGHYHKPQVHEWGMYLGSPLHLKFSEGGITARGFWDVDLAAKVIDPQLVTPDYPLFDTVNVELAAGEHLDDYVDDLSEVVGEGVRYLRFIMTGDALAIEASRKLLGKWRGELDKYNLRRIKVDERPERVTRARLKLTKKTFDLDEAMGAYARELAPAGTDHHALAELGKRLLGEART